MLAERPEDGKIIVERDEKGQVSAMKYLSLNPTSCLKRIMDQVKSLILISGTLEPSQEYNQLIKTLSDADRDLARFSCDHIIKPQHF